MSLCLCIACHSAQHRNGGVMKHLKIVICICIGIFLCGCSLMEENVGERKEQNKITMQKGRSDMKSPEPVWKNYNAYLQDYNNYSPGEILGVSEKFHEINKNAKDKRKSWEDKMGNSMTFPEKGSIYYATKEYEDSYSWLLNREDFSSVCKENNEAAQTAARKVIDNITERLQISVANTETFYLNKAALNQLSQLFMTDQEYEEALADGEEEFKRRYKEEDCVVLVKSNICIGDGTLYFREYDVGNRNYMGSHLNALVKNGKVLWLDIEGAVAEVEEREENTVISSDAAEQKLQEQYKSLQIEGEITCINEGIFYVLTEEKDGAYRATPAYSFSVHYEMRPKQSKSNEKELIDEKVLLNATNGQWIR